MRWQGRRGSENVQDHRRIGPGRMVGFGGGTLGLVIIIIYLCLGGDPRALMQMQQQANPPAQNGEVADTEIPKDDPLAQFVSVVLADTEEVWQQLFQDLGESYREPTLIIFRDQVRSACGIQGSATGPFYCPADAKVYIDLTFFDEMERRLGAGGDFAQAYVVAHEVGHHVQNLTGIAEEVAIARQRVGQTEGNQLSVRQELHADYLAGVWAHHAEKQWSILEEGDVDEALNAATAIGDDRLQKRSQGVVVPESFTHGTSEQRSRWFLAGFKSGSFQQGNEIYEIPYDEL